MNFHLSKTTLYPLSLSELPAGKLLINTLNAHSFNTAQTDTDFQVALQKSDILIPDGISVVMSVRFLTGQKLKKIAGADLFAYEMERLNASGGKCFFLGSSESTLQKIQERASHEYPHVQVYTYSPPYKAKFSETDNQAMVSAVNAVTPDVLFVGMTAPKQEKWAYQHFSAINASHVCCIGAVFDFYAGTVTRAPRWMIAIGMEWFYRLIKEPRRMWRRYLIGNTKFIWLVMKEKITM
jgi:bacterial polymer biosynthesis proteins, WecB/TagA/CpsF family